MENINQSTSQEDENLKQQISEEANVPQVNLNASKFDKINCNLVDLSVVIFFILNIATKGKVPGGFKGGVVGFIAGYGSIQGFYNFQEKVNLLLTLQIPVSAESSALSNSAGICI
ncbi:MAG: hypothetical protein IPH77_08480 [Ignavibacteria bacterium]|nr:hypothetical protein [Ignavibacteria bacterium]